VTLHRRTVQAWIVDLQHPSSGIPQSRFTNSLCPHNYFIRLSSRCIPQLATIRRNHPALSKPLLLLHSLSYPFSLSTLTTSVNPPLRSKISPLLIESRTMSSTDRQPRRWTTAEDQTLRKHVDAQQEQGGGRDWCQIALALPGRTNKDCRKRWHNSVAEGLRKGQWSKPEDQLLTHGVHRYGNQWTKVATCVSSRSADQCAKRWQQSLDPRLDRSEWREDEDIALLAAVERLGRHWKDIQEQCLQHRSKNCVKNRYSVLARRTATQLVSYDDSVGSSSSDPGTPLQMEAVLPLEFTSMAHPQDTAQVLYMQHQTTHASNDDSAWAWSGVANPNASMNAVSHELLVNSPWPAHHNQALPTSQTQWNDMQTALSLQYHMPYPAASNPHDYVYTYQMHQQPLVSSSMPYAVSQVPSFDSNAPPVAERSPRVPTQINAHELRRRDSAPFGQPSNGHPY
jgi:myb proto-oncogene protein